MRRKTCCMGIQYFVHFAYKETSFNYFYFISGGALRLESPDPGWLDVKDLSIKSTATVINILSQLTEKKQEKRDVVLPWIQSPGTVRILLPVRTGMVFPHLDCAAGLLQSGDLLCLCPLTWASRHVGSTIPAANLFSQMNCCPLGEHLEVNLKDWIESARLRCSLSRSSSRSGRINILFDIFMLARALASRQCLSEMFTDVYRRFW